MKVDLMKRLVSFREWAIGFHAHGKMGTLIGMIGTNWSWGLSHGPSSNGSGHVFGLCLGPLTFGGYINLP